MSIAKLKDRLHKGKYDGIFTRKNGEEVEVYYLTADEVSLFLPSDIEDILEALEIPCEYFHTNETITVSVKDRRSYEKNINIE
jgi:hypothetical protein